MKIGSLFDGSGGFPLAATLCGIEPVWAAEVEPYPIAVTRSRFPKMKHLGSVTEVKGNEIEPVDIISFGAPCQDLSVAGRRAGLRHEELGDEETTRSGLFMEAVRIIKEMREATNGEYPRFAIYENVPGAFSSSKGNDWRIVLEEIIKIVEPTAVMPDVPKNGWPYADCYVGNGWSLAYRVFDAQYWGVPQRRRRIYLVADFRGGRAGKVSFEREGLRGYFAEGGTPRKGIAGDAERGTGAADGGLIPYTLKIRTGVAVDSAGKAAGKGALIQRNKAATLAVSQDQYLFQPVCSSGDVAGTLDASYFKGCGMRQGVEREYVVEPIAVATQQGGAEIPTNGVCPTVYESHPMDSRIKELEDGVSPTVSVKWHKGAADTPLVCYSVENHPADSRVNIDDSGKAQTLTSRMGTGGGNVPMVMEAKAFAMQGFGDYKESDVASGLKARDYKDATDLVAEVPVAEDGPTPTREGRGHNDVALRYIVRRLTPTECARLQGFPDDWAHPDIKTELTDEEYAFWLNVRNAHAAINDKVVKDYTRDQMLSWYNKLHTDSAEYKLWGNGIALPCALYVMQGIAEGVAP